MANTSYTVSETMSVNDDLRDYDVISDSTPRSLESSIADLDSPTLAGTRPAREIPPTAEARRVFETSAYTPEEIRAYVQRNVVTSRRSRSRDPSEREKAIRVYVDGVFDVLHAGNALQLRQAKLSFPSVRLIVGPFTEQQCRLHGLQVDIPHVERCELVRHCRWVDDVILDAPVVLDENFLARNRIDYVAVEEGSSVDPAISKERLAGYDLVKSLGKALPTRRTRGVIASTLSLSSSASLESPKPKRQVTITEHLNTVHISDDPIIPEPKEDF